jgi:3',5'-cyclic AMP phosphodiesterase CpdA
MTGPVVLAQLTDPHIGATWSAADPVSGFARAVAGVCELRPAAVLVSGDLTDHATDSEYETLRELLEPIDVPVYLMVGNHDDRQVMRRHFELAGTGGEPLQYAVDVGALRLVALDSQRSGSDAGELDEARLGWLDGELAAAPDAPTLVAVHHHPASIGIPAFDRIGLSGADQEAFGEVLGRHRQVLAVVAGHVHRSCTTVIAGRPAFTAPSTYDQVVLDFGSDQLVFGTQPPGFAVHVLTDGRLVSHVQPIGRRIDGGEG